MADLSYITLDNLFVFALFLGLNSECIYTFLCCCYYFLLLECSVVIAYIRDCRNDKVRYRIDNTVLCSEMVFGIMAHFIL